MRLRSPECLMNEYQPRYSISVMQTYKHEIEMQKVRINASHNGFVRTCCRQEIDQLKAEKEAIEMDVAG